MTNTLQTINNYLNYDHLVCVDGRNQLRSVSALNWFSRLFHSLFVGKEKAFADCKAAKVAEAVKQLFEQHPLTPVNYWNAIDFLRKLGKRVKKQHSQAQLLALANETAQRILTPKRQLIDRAIQHLKTTPEPSPLHSEMLFFLKKWQKRIAKRERTALPFWFHATPDEQRVYSILNSSLIKQNQAVRGFGAYVSSSDEAGQVIGYGRYTFAVDQDFIEDKPAAFFVPNPEDTLSGWILNRVSGWKCPSIWVRVESDIPINTRSISYIGYPHAEETSLVARSEIEKKHPWVRFMNRQTSEKICELFRKVSVRHIPSQWHWHETMEHVPMPAHFSIT